MKIGIQDLKESVFYIQTFEFINFRFVRLQVLTHLQQFLKNFVTVQYSISGLVICLLGANIFYPPLSAYYYHYYCTVLRATTGPYFLRQLQALQASGKGLGLLYVQNLKGRVSQDFRPLKKKILYLQK